MENIANSSRALIIFLMFLFSHQAFADKADHYGKMIFILGLPFALIPPIVSSITFFALRKSKKDTLVGMTIVLVFSLFLLFVLKELGDTGFYLGLVAFGPTVMFLLIALIRYYRSDNNPANY